MTWLTNVLNSAALDIAGLGFIGAGIYLAIAGSDQAAQTVLFGLGGSYLGAKGYQAAVSTAASKPAPPA